MIGIYKITSPTNRVYIGQSIDIEKRFIRYNRLDCKVQHILYNSFKKYGVDKHRFEIICECEIEELNEKERYYQDLYCVLDKGGLNCILTKSSDRKGRHSQETKLKMSKSAKNRTDGHLQKLAQSAKFRKVSDETRLKMSIARKGKKISEKTRLKLIEAKRNMSEETKQKMSKAKRNISDETRRKLSEAAKNRSKGHNSKLIESLKNTKE